MAVSETGCGAVGSRIEGVRGFTNLITVKTRPTLSELKEKIEDALIRNARLDAERITVEVQGSKAILERKGALLGGERRGGARGVAGAEDLSRWKTGSQWSPKHRRQRRLRPPLLACPFSQEPQMNTWKYTPNEAAVGWTCATCGELITKIEDGWVEWLAGEDKRGHAKLGGLRLVHRVTAGPDGVKWGGCQYDKRQEFKKGQNVVEGLSLGRFVGPDGLMLLLSLIAEEELPVRDVLELAKRVQIPGYEQARDLFPKAILQGIIEPSIGTGYYLQSEIQMLLQWSVRRAV